MPRPPVRRQSTTTPRTPKTPQDEAIAFFSGESDGEAVLVWELWLDGDGGPPEGKSYVRLPPPVKPYVLRFSIHAGTPCTRNAVLKSDFPMDGGVFERGVWSERELPSDVSRPIHVDLAISAPGAFAYFIEHDSAEGRVIGRRGYFNVDPIISLPARTPFKLAPPADPLHDTTSAAIEKKNVNLPLDALSILSVIAKWQGKINEWDPYLAEASRRGYNMIHYTPLHTRGSSGSPYSIADQLSFDPTLLTDPKAEEGGIEQIAQTLERAKSKYGLGAITDVVLNHTAFDTPWLEDHPEAGYSPYNTPHLAPAVELEDAMLKLTDDLATSGRGAVVIRGEEDLMRLRDEIQGAISGAHLWQYYVFDVATSVEEVEAALKAGKVTEWFGESLEGKAIAELGEIAYSTPDFVENYRTFSKRFGTHVPADKAAGFAKAAFPTLSGADLARQWGKLLDIANVNLYKECNEDLAAARDNIVGRLRYTRLEKGGPQLGAINKKNPIVEQYFTRIPKTEKTKKFPAEALAVANNGWMWAADPLKNFAEYPSKAYLRREVIVWGDCVKLRYGRGPSDNPWLWAHMTEYAEMLASVFDGFRLDNCHSTPLHVGVHIIDAGRRINPNLYVMAELFTGSEETDLKFVRELGLNSLVREAYNGNDNKEFARLLYRFGVGKPIGSMAGAVLSEKSELPPLYHGGAPRPCIVTPLPGSAPHAVFYDVTHDNESPAHKRTAEDALSTGALVTFTKAAIGSNKGFDDLYPQLLNLVTDTRMYNVADDNKGGIGRVKRILNNLHTEMMYGGYDEGHVHEEGEYIMIHRVHPRTHKGYMLVAHTAFPGSSGRGWVNPFKLSRTKVEFLFGATLHTRLSEWKDDDKVHYGIPSTLEEIPAETVKIVNGRDDHGDYTQFTVPDKFDPGSILVFSTDMSEMSSKLEAFCRSGASEAFGDLNLVELNVVLHRADGEERDATGGDGVYNIPDFGALVYCGLEGWMAPLRSIVEHNDLGHPLCEHLRQGTWALDYVHDRLHHQTDVFPNLDTPAKWYKDRFDVIKATVPDFMRPKFFSLVIFEAYKAARQAVFEQQSEFISSGTTFIHDLALCSVQMYGQVKSASIIPSRPVPSLAAGLPHFTAGWGRCWGRDVFISLRGLFLTTGNYEAAREHIHAFGATLKHGLIPNLLDSGRNPRYNSRDSPWWFVQNIQDYTKHAPDGLSLLDDPVKRRFPSDDTWIAWDDPRAFSWSSTVAELVQEIVQRHAEGIEFREYNAGPNIDGDMKDEGFNQKIWTDWETGFIHGGNRYNCGTWMDKMGSSAKAGNKGLPATPRDGAPIEITGLLKSTLSWLAKLSEKGKFPFEGVHATVRGQKAFITYKQWADLIQSSFEKHYFVPVDPAEDDQFVINKGLVNRRGMYKDVYGTPKDREWSDYQLRCNFTLPMVVAPELFTPSRAIAALRLADKVIRSPLGMKTLDPSDSQYRPDYDNKNDGTDITIANGWNYHQGPEWGFPLGWFLTAWLRFDRLAGDGVQDPSATMHHISAVFLKLRKHIEKDPWRGLPELTNHDGSYCRDSCNTQAWSASTILDVLEEMHKLGKV
ncbi:hypothetical protein VHUM_03787 [Vanrija humicola]|uniref:Glycogen debranching enzyme n=1 Tax=Vanrija humicola TaxID=5417 RepID=A0A7D8ZH23_VANHU|nr:hypothetical protein VHUM_03787 [Vanrija humicola]